MKDDISDILSAEPKFRRQQIYLAWFDTNISGYEQITTLPVTLREKLRGQSWLAVKPITVQSSRQDETQKALLELADGAKIETILMPRPNKKQASDKFLRYTTCVSTQVGCAMRCIFCATGKLGFTRNLTAQEIVDQYRFWQKKLAPEGGRVENVVLMGQGEPLLNYEAVKEALNILLKYANIGPRKITISTAGIPTIMDQMIADKEFPPVRFALSLHNALEADRARLMPAHQNNFLKFLIDWSHRYHAAHPSRTHFIGLEYIMLKKINDTPEHLKALIKLAGRLGRVRINLIPFNTADCNANFTGSDTTTIERWRAELMKAGFTVTIRRSQGQDISAACGQLALKKFE